MRAAAGTARDPRALAVAGLGVAGLGALAGVVASAADPPMHALAMLGVLGVYVALRPLADDPPPLAIPYALPLGLIGVALLLGMSVAERAQPNEAAAWFSSAVAAVVVADQARRPGGADRMAAWGCGLLAAGAGAALLAWVTGFRELKPFTLEGAGRLSWPFEHPNLLGAFCAMLIPIAVACALGRRGRARWAAAGCALIGLGALLATASRGGWIGLAAGLAVVAALGLGRRVILGGGALLLVAAAPVLIPRLTDADVGTGNVRIDMWRASLESIRDDPLTGVGHQNLQDAIPPLVTARDASPVIHAHDLYLNFAAELGVLGVVAIVAVLVMAARAAARGRGVPALRTAAVGTLGSIAALATTGVLDHPLEIPETTTTFWAVMGLAAGIGAAAHPRRPPG